MQKETLISILKARATTCRSTNAEEARCLRKYQSGGGRQPRITPEKSVLSRPSNLVRKIRRLSACAALLGVRTIMVLHRKTRTKNHNGKTTRPSGILRWEDS